MPYHRDDPSVSTSLVCRIRVGGPVDPDLSEYVRWLSITTETASDETSVTTLEGKCPDQSALIGILNTLANFDMPLISLVCVSATDESRTAESL